MPQRGVEVMSDGKRQAFEYDGFSAFYGAPCIRESGVVILLACVNVFDLKAASNKTLFSTWSNMENAKVAGPKWLVVILGGHLGEAMVAGDAVDPNTMPNKTRVHFVCDR
jgi:hypothetical protein